MESIIRYYIDANQPILYQSKGKRKRKRLKRSTQLRY